MAILGNNTKGPSSLGLSTGRIFVSPFVLASPQTMTELWVWLGGGNNTKQARAVIYADSAGSPGTRVAYTAAQLVQAADAAYGQSGLSVALAAGTYWIGVISEDAPGVFYYTDPGTGYKGISTGAPFNPPPNPFGSPGSTNATRGISAWAVVGAAAGVTFVPQVVIL